MKTKIIIIISAILVIIALTLLIIKFSREKTMSANVKTETIDFSNENDIYVRAMAWGLAGNHNVIALSDKPFYPEKRKVIHGEDIVFYTTELYYKKINDTCLSVAVSNSSLHDGNPDKLNGIRINFHYLKSYDDILKFDKEYKTLGYNKICIYDSNKKEEKALPLD